MKNHKKYCNLTFKCAYCNMNIDRNPMVKPEPICEKYNVYLKLDVDEMSIISYSECINKKLNKN